MYIRTGREGTLDCKILWYHYFVSTDTFIMVPRGLLNIDLVVQNFSNQAFPPIILILIRGILFIVIKGLHKFIVHCLFPQVPDVRMKIRL